MTRIGSGFGMSRDPINDPRLSWGAKGYLAYICANSDPDGFFDDSGIFEKLKAPGQTRAQFEREIKRYASELVDIGYLSKDWK